MAEEIQEAVQIIRVAYDGIEIINNKGQLHHDRHLQSRREVSRGSKTDLICQSTSPSICICLQAKAFP